MNKSINIFSSQPIQNIFNQYQIQLSYDLDKIYFKIQNKYYIYESYFNLEYLNELLDSNFSIDEMIEFINGLINQKSIKIEKNENNLQLIFISIHLNAKLFINKKNILSNELIEKLINEIEKIKNENKRLKKRIEFIENNNNELNNKIKILEGFHFIKDKYKTKLTKCNLQNIASIQPHKNWINSLCSFPSGNIISVSNDKSIIIYDIHLNILQNIQNAHDDAINYVEVKDENYFITCSDDKSIKLWNNKENKFIVDKIINNAHEDDINKVIHCSNGNLISCSKDKKIKLWKENNNYNNYENINILTHSNKIYSILLLEDKNILISSGKDGTKFWDLNDINNIDCIKYFKDTYSGWNGTLCRLDEDRIIVQGDFQNSLKVISILNLNIIKEINNPFHCSGITLIEDKGIFIVGGESKDIRIYRNDNYECIQEIQDAHDNSISGFIELKDCTIASFSNDNKIKIWRF